MKRHHEKLPRQRTRNLADELPPSMKAVTYGRYGGPEVLEYSSVARPEATPGKVRVRAAGLDRGTWHLMAGEPRAARLAVELRTPRNPIPGLDFAGEVAGIGAGVSGFTIGDRVVGVAGGAFAEFVVADAGKLVQLPEGIGWEQAGALPVSGVTARQALAKAGELDSETRMLVTGASGGVGSFVVQMAKLRGVHVSAECSAAKTDFVASLGADEVHDHATGTAFAKGSHYEVVIDIGGSPAISTLRRVLTSRGRAVIVGAENPGSTLIGMGRQLRAVLLSPFLHQSLSMLVSVNKQEDLQALVDLMAQGQLESHVDRAFALNEARAAMEYLVAGRVRGKVVLVP